MGKPELSLIEEANLKLYKLFGMTSRTGPRGSHDKRVQYHEVNNRSTKAVNAGLKWAILLVFLPLFVLSLMVMGAGEVGLVIGGFFAVSSGLCLLFLVPTYFVCEGVRRHRDAKEADRQAAVATADRIATAHEGRVHVGGGIHLYRDGVFRDRNWNELSPDNPRVRGHLEDRVHLGGRVYLHGDGSYRDDRYRRLSPDDPKVREHLEKRREDGS